KRLFFHIAVGAVVAGAYALAGHWQTQSRWERWFATSTYLMAGTFITYVFLLLYRPVKYRLRVRPVQRDRASAILAQYGRTTQDFFKIWPDKSYFFSDSGDSFVAFSVGHNFAVVLGDPAGPAEEFPGLIRKF